MLGRLFLLFILVPMMELMLLIRLGQAVGLLPTFSLILATGFVGALLARREGFRAFNRFSETVAKGQLPTDAALDGIAVLIGGAFLLTPGIITDLLGFALLLPPVRAIFKRRLIATANRRMQEGALRVHVSGMGAWQSGMGPMDPRAGAAGWAGGASIEESDTAGRGGATRSDPREIVVPPRDEVD